MAWPLTESMTAEDEEEVEEPAKKFTEFSTHFLLISY